MTKNLMLPLHKVPSRSRSIVALLPATLALSSAQAEIVLTSTDNGSGPFATSVWNSLYWDFVNQTYSDTSLTGPYAFQTYTKGIGYIETYASPYNVGNKFVATDGDSLKIYAEGDNVSDADSFGIGSYYLDAEFDVPFYVGFSFEINNQTHYGWALLEIIESSGNALQVLHEFAYESEAGKAIPVGAIPEPDQVAMLAALAAGSAAALAARRRRKETQAA